MAPRLIEIFKSERKGLSNTVSSKMKLRSHFVSDLDVQKAAVGLGFFVGLRWPLPKHRPICRSGIESTDRHFQPTD
jgi:hypothetical protein